MVIKERKFYQGHRNLVIAWKSVNQGSALVTDFIPRRQSIKLGFLKFYSNGNRKQQTYRQAVEVTANLFVFLLIE